MPKEKSQIVRNGFSLKKLFQDIGKMAVGIATAAFIWHSAHVEDHKLVLEYKSFRITIEIIDIEE
jgi:hypothetical protein